MIKFIDLFAGLGGMRLGFEQACATLGIEAECVLTSEIKPSAIMALHENFVHKNMVGDITQIQTKDLPDFDFLGVVVSFLGLKPLTFFCLEL